METGGCYTVSYAHVVKDELKQKTRPGKGEPPAETWEPEDPASKMEDVAEAAVPTEPTTPPSATAPNLPTRVPVTSQLEEIDEFQKTFAEPIFAERSPDGSTRSPSRIVMRNL